MELSDLLSSADRAALRGAIRAMKKVHAHVEKNHFNQWCNEVGVTRGGDETITYRGLISLAQQLRGVAEFVQLCDNTSEAKPRAQQN